LKAGFEDIELLSVLYPKVIIWIFGYVYAKSLINSCCVQFTF
jgi:hypothetical protein